MWTPSDIPAETGTWTFADLGRVFGEHGNTVEYLTVMYVAVLCAIVWSIMRNRRKRQREERLLLELSRTDLRQAMGRIRQRYARGYLDGEDYQRLHDAMRGRE